MPHQFFIPRLRPKHIGLSRKVNVINHHIKLSSILRQPPVRIGMHDLDAQGIQVHVFTRQVDNLPINVHRHQFAIRQQMPQHAKRRATGQSQHQHRTRRMRHTHQGRCRNHVPRQARQKPITMIKRMHRPRHPKLSRPIRLPNFQRLITGLHNLLASHH